MARQARKHSESGIYHIMLRGVNYQTIFEDSEDEDRFLALLQNYKKRCGFELYGYCMMGNHVHLLLREAARNCVIHLNGMDLEAGPGEPLEQVFKRIGVSYVTYFNQKYRRVGHLFQDRYRSEPVDTDAYLLMALRYIHRNPVKAGICTAPEEYLRSSYREYLNPDPTALTDTKFVLGMITEEELKEYTEQENEDRFLDIEDDANWPKTDEEAKERMKVITGCKSASDFQKLKKTEREEYITQMHREGLNIAQLGRITGYSRQVIYRAIGK